MTETNNLSFEKSKDKNFKKLEIKKVYHHKKQKTISEMGFNLLIISESHSENKSFRFVIFSMSQSDTSGIDTNDLQP